MRAPTGAVTGGSRCRGSSSEPVVVKTCPDRPLASMGSWRQLPSIAELVRTESLAAVSCTECGRVSREIEHGWTARLTVDDEVAVYCPECDEREFGETDERT